MPLVSELARFAVRASAADLSAEARRELRIRILDALGCAVGALGAAPVRAVDAHLATLGGRPLASRLGRSEPTAPDRAALWNGFLVRYLDFNDSYLAPGETCHPSDGLGAVLAAAEFAHASGEDVLAALAVAYQVQCRLSDEAPVRARGFDHVTQGAYAWAAGAARALGLDAERAAHAVAIAGTALVSLRVTRTGALSHWKGLAAPHTAAAATHATFLARAGITGPEEVFEGNKGFMDAVAGRFSIDWAREDLERVRRTILKKFNAEVHSQSALEAAVELREAHGITGKDVERVELDVFDVAYHIIGGGEEGDKTRVRTKEEADHSLPYMLAVALLDGDVLPDQYTAERIASDDVQDLLRRVEIREAEDLSRRFPEEHACRLRLHLRDGRVLEREKRDYEGFHTRPMSWETAGAKFRKLAGRRLGPELTRELLEAVEGLEERSARELGAVLRRVPDEGGEAGGVE